MAKMSGKVWGGILGMMFGGPLGAIAGVYIGHRLDTAQGRRDLAMDVVDCLQHTLAAKSIRVGRGAPYDSAMHSRNASRR